MGVRYLDEQPTDSPIGNIRYLDEGAPSEAASPKSDIPVRPAKPVPRVSGSLFGIPLYSPTAGADMAIHLGTGALGRFLGLDAAGLSALTGGGTEGAQDWLKRTQDALTIQPQSDAGKEALSDAGKAAQWLANTAPVKAVTNAYQDFTTSNPKTGAALAALPDLAGVMGMKAPLEAATAGTRNAVGGALQSKAQDWMIQAIRPTVKELQSGQGATAAQTMLKYGLNPTKTGVEKLGTMIDDINTQIANKIAASKAVVSRDNALSYLDPTRESFAKQVAPTADLAAIKRVAADFKATQPESIPIQNAQALKQGTYRNLTSKAYGEEGTAATEAQKSIARGLKEQIAAAEPDVATLNATDSDLIKTLSIAERRQLNQMRSGILGHSPLAYTKFGFMAYMADKSPAFKALAARMMNSLGGAIKVDAPAAATPIPAAPVKTEPTPPNNGGGLLPVGEVTEVPMPAGVFGDLNKGSTPENFTVGQGAVTNEAVRRFESDQAAGRFRYIGNKYSSSIRQLNNPTEVDLKPGPGQIIAQKGIGNKPYTELARGKGVTDGMVERFLAKLKEQE